MEALTTELSTLTTPSTAAPHSEAFNRGQYVVMGILLMVTGLGGAIFNGLVIVVIRLSRRLRGSTYRLVEALCWSQMLEGLMGNPLSSASAFSMRWIAGEVGCSYYGFVMTVFGIFSINILTAISLERYVCICKPTKKMWLSDRLVNGSIVVCFLAALLWGVFPLAGWSEYESDGIGIGCCPTYSSHEGTYSYTLAMLVLEAVLPVLLIVIAYASIAHTVRQSHQTMTLHVHAAADTSKNLSKRERRVTAMIAIFIGAFIISWTPYAVTSMMFALSSPVGPLAVTLSALVAKCSTIWNPIIILASNAHIRGALVALVTRSRGPDTTSAVHSDSRFDHSQTNNTRVEPLSAQQQPQPPSPPPPAQ